MSDVRPNPRIASYDAPETAPDGYVRRVLCIPVDDDYRIVAAVNDVLGYLSLPGVWNPSEELSEIDMQAIMTEMWLGYFGELEIMIGAVVAMTTDVLPAFMVWCEGQTLLRSAYPELYGRLNPVFRLNDDEFIVPDLRERFIFGTGVPDETPFEFGNTGGQTSVELSVSELPAHHHDIAPHSHTYNYPAFNIDIEGAGVPDILGAGNPGIPTLTSSTGLTTDDTGLSNAHDNMPPYFVLRYAMVAKWRDGC